MTNLDRAERLSRRAEQVIHIGELADRLAQGSPLRVKFGVDPTARDVTLGWAVPLRKLREFQEDGHVAVLVVGDFTARIGDPSGKSSTRPRLEKDVVMANAEACLNQLSNLLLPVNLEVRFNSTWLEGLNLEDVLRLTSLSTVAQVLEREDFSTRFAQERPISITEFLYPLLQGYDSVAIHADVELGGTDQLFNLLVGRDLQRAYGQRAQVVMTMPLLEGLDGVQKMSQSLGNYISVRDEPAEMFGKVMSIPDQLISKYAQVAAELSPGDVDRLWDLAKRGGSDAALAKREVARAIVELHHPGEGEAAERAFDHQFVHRQQPPPEDIPTYAVPMEYVSNGFIDLPAVITAMGWTRNKGQARDALRNGSIRVDGERHEEPRLLYSPFDYSDRFLLQMGQKRYAWLDLLAVPPEAWADGYHLDPVDPGDEWL
jgi:tyrosyl-tRNA synthetase